MTDRSLIKAELQNLQKILEAKADMCIGAGKMKMLSFANACSDALELLKAKDTNVLTKWISVKDRLPEEGDSYIVAGKMRLQGEPWEYFTDVAASHGCYIDGFWDTFNDWVEGNETHITHWMPMPEPPKEEEDD